MPVLREELADRDLPLFRGHRLRGGPSLRLGGRVFCTHVPTGIDHTGRMSSLEAEALCPFKRAQTCATRRRPEQTAPARLRTLILDAPPSPTGFRKSRWEVQTADRAEAPARAARPRIHHHALDARPRAGRRSATRS